MKISMNHEYDKLVSCIMVYPSNIQAPNYTTLIDKQIVYNQYNDFVRILFDNGIEISFLESNGSSSQVFTRDIGFIIDDILFISNMTQPERQTEIERLIDLVKIHTLKSHIMKNKAEGGDIMVHHNKVFIGVGNRTNLQAVEEIRHVLSLNNKQYELITVLFDASKIHLDCVFNILDQHTCILSEEVFNRKNILKHFENFMEVSMKEQESLATNIVDLGNNIILCSSKNFSKKLHDQGYQSIYINLSEIIKAKGSLGCCLMPLLRKS